MYVTSMGSYERVEDDARGARIIAITREVAAA